jgi:ankyrin repeat protein
MNINKKNERLLTACYKVDIKKIKHYIDRGANINTLCPFNPLISSIKSENRELFSFLIENILSLKLNIDIQDNTGKTPLIHSLYKNYDYFIKKLLDCDTKPNLEIKTNKGNNALIICAQLGDSEKMKRLIDAGCNVNAKNKYGHTTLELLSLNKFVRCYQILLKFNK